MKKAESRGSVFQRKKTKEDGKSRQEKDKKGKTRPIIDLNESPDKQMRLLLRLLWNLREGMLLLKGILISFSKLDGVNQKRLHERKSEKTKTKAKTKSKTTKHAKVKTKPVVKKEATTKKNEEPVDEESFSNVFSVVFNHGGEFCKENNNFFYRGGKQTVVDGEDMDNFTKSRVNSLIMGWGYEQDNFKVWSRYFNEDEGFWQVNRDDDFYEVACGILGGPGDGQVYVEHKDDESDGSGFIEYDSDEVEGLDDSEDERAARLDDGFVKNPHDEKTFEENMKMVVSSIGCGDTKFENDEYESEELCSSDPDASDDESDPKVERYKKGDIHKGYKWKTGLEFNSLKDFREAIRDWSALKGCPIDWVKNEGDRVRVECERKCGFYMLCSRVGQDHTFAIKTEEQYLTHSCIRTLYNKTANSKWVSKEVVKLMQTFPKVRLRDIAQHMRTHFALGISKNTAWKAKKYATEIIEGDSDRQYSLLRRYADELIRVCKENTVVIGLAERPVPTLPPRFGSFYFCLNGSKKGFINGCRPFIGVDGCYLKTRYGGQMLIAVGRDPNDQYFPLAFGVVETETKESWRWFIQLLMEDIGQDNRFVFISDQQKGLVAVFEEMFERVEHRLCLRHLYANFKKKFGGGTLIRDLMMGAAKATYYQACEAKMSELKAFDKKAWDWLKDIPTKMWCKHAFSYYPKCDVLMNNLSKSFNATILVARDKPILTLCEWIRNYLMNRTYASVSKLANWPHRILPMPQRRLEKEVSMTGYWQPTWVIHEEFQCNQWCDMWPKPPDGVEENILPPLYKKGPGRPRKLRIREFDDAGVRKPRKGKYHCTTCGHLGHNAGSCKLPQDPNALNRKRKPSNGKASDSQGPASVSQPPASASQPSAVASQPPASASQPSAVASQDLFGDIPDEFMASIPDVKVIEKKLPVKSKKHKGDHHQHLYHGMKRRTSERIKMNSFKTPVTGVGSSQTQPIVINA
ncbi:hypothetical protein TSUD_393740 [Trifolium subterraneum]|uniref:CCHC-type domain-containing protein n=1 Tax=Trifolium subterraneum TaxID=3900 RepID=A0A2Z6MST4_TRISU|nr:hypothetical protein TSUD_393740 [Trifolium subterraneum]